MIIDVTVKANESKTKILSQDGTSYKIAVKAKAENGKANDVLLLFLEKHFQAQCKLLTGKTSPKKKVSVLL